MEVDLIEQQINIRGVCINFVKIGNGEHPVLLLPAALATIWSAFKPQVKNLDRKTFTIVAWDPPGYGKSRPPDREFPEDFLQQDASFAKDLMHALGYKTFSMIGWCNGGVTACLLAATYPDSVRKIVIVNTNSYITSEEITIYTSLRGLRGLSVRWLYELTAANGYHYLKSLWESWINAMVDAYEKRQGDLCTTILGKIQCPTLIVQGGQDHFVNKSHAAFINDRIKHSRMCIFEKGSHFLHLKDYEEFNKLATDFLSS